MNRLDEERAAVAAAARRVADEGLVIGTAGNLSAAVGEQVAVTGSGVVLASCQPADVVVVDRDGAVLAGDLAPTSELELHLGVYADTGASAIVHSHPAVGTALSTVLTELPCIHYQQLLLGGPVRVAPYATFGTPELAEAVRTALAGRQAALMANHGSVAIGATLDQAVERALLLEWLCTVYRDACLVGTPQLLDPAQQEAVVLAALQRNYGSLARRQES